MLKNKKSVKLFSINDLTAAQKQRLNFVNSDFNKNKIAVNEHITTNLVVIIKSYLIRNFNDFVLNNTTNYGLTKTEIYNLLKIEFNEPDIFNKLFLNNDKSLKTNDNDRDKIKLIKIKCYDLINNCKNKQFFKTVCYESGDYVYKYKN